MMILNVKNKFLRGGQDHRLYIFVLKFEYWVSDIYILVGYIYDIGNVHTYIYVIKKNTKFLLT